jgi:spectinomycin phosphotransferase
VLRHDRAGDRGAATGGERFSASVREDFGVDLTSINRVGHGGDEQAELWRGVSVDGSPYAVKLSGGGTPAW